MDARLARHVGPVVTDPGNPRVKEARRLARRTFRDKVGRFLVEGPQAVRELVQQRPELLVELFVTPEAAAKHADIVAVAGRTTITTPEVIASLAETVTPQGMVAVAGSVTVSLDAVMAPGPAMLALLGFVRDPGNAGTVIRCADAAGADGVVLSTDSVDPHNGKCVRASAGSLFHLPLASDVPLPEVVAAAQTSGLTVIAADGSGRTDLDAAIDSGLLARPVAWLFGNEAWGLPTEARDLADDVIRVPIYGSAESLNLATAAAVCLYATAREQRRPGGVRRDR